MEALKKKMLKEAEEYRKQYIFPISIFYTPDYETSADKFKEVALICTEMDEKIKYLKEAVRTYLMNAVEYNRYNAYLLYQDIGELYRDKDTNECIRFYMKSAEMALSCNKKNLAANSFEKAYTHTSDTYKKIQIMKEVVKCYDSNSWKHHRLNSLKILAFLYFRNGDYELAANTFLDINTGVYVCCAGISFYLAGIQSDLEVDNEYEHIYKSLDESQEELQDAIVKYLDNHAVENEVRHVFMFCIDRLKPENDIL